MYYSELVRVRRIEKFLKRLAYSSVLLDALVAVATLFVIEGKSGYSGMVLMTGDYLIFVEVLLAAVAFASLLALRHYKKIFKGLDKMVFRARYKNTA
jgi:hypothetical protein